MKMKEVLLTILAVSCGAIITYVDTRPNWDDTGITAMAILLTSGMLGFSSPSRWWLWAIAVGLWIPLIAIASTQNLASILALIVAFIGALLGMMIRKQISVNNPNTP
jgi:hypothetical protein